MTKRIRVLKIINPIYTKDLGDLSWRRDSQGKRDLNIK